MQYINYTLGVHTLMFSLLLMITITLSLHAETLHEQTPKTIDPYAYIHIIPNPDGTVTRPKEFFPTVPPNSSFQLAISKDTPLNSQKDTWVRLYLPKDVVASSVKKLPIVIFGHGGGFVILSADTPKFDVFCSNAAFHLNALVVSVNYRSAPEDRLPAAYDDVLEALYWVKEGKDEWVNKYGDVTKCVLMGESAGGNIMYTVGLRVSASLVNDLKPLVIKGLVLVQPFFGGLERTGSELRLVEDTVLPLVVSDLFWNLSLPIGADRGHVYCDPLAGGGLASEVVKIRELGWAVVVSACDGDPLFDRAVEVVNRLEEVGVDVVRHYEIGYYHGVYTQEPSKAIELFSVVKNVFYKCFDDHVYVI